MKHIHHTKNFIRIAGFLAILTAILIGLAKSEESNLALMHEIATEPYTNQAVINSPVPVTLIVRERSGEPKANALIGLYSDTVVDNGYHNNGFFRLPGEAAFKSTDANGKVTFNITSGIAGQVTYKPVIANLKGNDKPTFAALSEDIAINFINPET